MTYYSPDQWVREFLVPKLDWDEDDYINYQDFNRIFNNEHFIKWQIYYSTETMLNLYDNPFTSYHALGYASDVNKIEDNIKILTEYTGLSALGFQTTKWPTRRNPDYTDANRWEEQTYQIKVILGNSYQYLPRCGVFNCGQERPWQVRFRIYGGIDWTDFDLKDKTWSELESFDYSWKRFERNSLPIYLGG